MKQNNILAYLLSRKADLIKLILGAFILALGTSLLANYLTDWLSDKMNVVLIISISLISLVVLYFVYSLLKDTKKSISIESVIVIDPKNKEIFPIPRFEFSERLNRTMKAVFLENEALKKYWEDDFKSKKANEKKEPIDKKANGEEQNSDKKVEYFSIVRIDRKEDEQKKEKKSDVVLEEAIEHVIIDQLSIHLSTFFNDYSNEDQLITELTRKDIPDILLKNRVVNLLSTPFEDRAIFVKAGIADKPREEGEVVSIFGSDGSKYERFDLVLPKGSKVSRPKRCSLEIDNKRINFKIEMKNEGFGSTLPHGFEYNYLGVIDRDLVVKKLDIALTYTIKPLSLLYSSKWNYHDWIDSFAERLEEFASVDKFVERINWDSTLTSIITNNQRKKIIREMEKEKLPPTKPISKRAESGNTKHSNTK